MPAMFLLHPDIFWWDLTILVLLSFSLSGLLVCEVSCRRNRRKRFWKAGIRCIGFLALTGFALITYGSFVEPYILTTTKFTVPFASNEALRIAVIGDLHTGPYTHGGQIGQVTDKVNKLLPDIVLLTGDFILGDTSDLALLDPLKSLHATQGVYAVLGNHDAGFVRSFSRDGLRKKQDRRDAIATKLDALGITVLRNAHKIVQAGDDTIAIAGTEDLWTGEQDLAAALDGIPEGTSTILLSHNPSIVLDPLGNRIDLVVSGHTHGGQIQLPWIGSLPAIPTELGQDFMNGIFPLPTTATTDQEKPHGYLFITKGVGASGPRSRLFTWPEIALLTTTDRM